jgi:hypothetical protein
MAEVASYGILEGTGTPAPRRRLRHGRFARIAHPGYGYCLRCGTPWPATDPHETYVGTGGGCFPLCGLCWGELTPEQRLPYYKHLMAIWRGGGSGPDPGYEEMLMKAVLEGR